MPRCENVEVKAVPSQYGGGIASVRATLPRRCGGPATLRDERDAIGATHVLAAALIVKTPMGARWCLPRVDLESSYRDTVVTTITCELARGDQAEADQAMAVLRAVIERM